MHQRMYTQIQQCQYKVWFRDSLYKQYMITITNNAQYLCNNINFRSDKFYILDSIWIVISQKFCMLQLTIQHLEKCC